MTPLAAVSASTTVPRELQTEANPHPFPPQHPHGRETLKTHRHQRLPREPQPNRAEMSVEKVRRADAVRLRNACRNFQACSVPDAACNGNIHSIVLVSASVFKTNESNYSVRRRQDFSR